MNPDLSQSSVLKCFHCGNETLMSQKGGFSWSSHDDGFRFSFTYKLFECPVCHKASLFEEYTDDSMVFRFPGINDSIEEERSYSSKIVFPVNSFDSNALPRGIRESYEAALRVRQVDITGCVLLLRRTIEMVMTDQGATSWGLQKKIEEIAEKGLIPPALREASFFTKKFGDSAAHGNELNADAEDTKNLLDFTEYIIEYLYIIPEKINSLKLKIEKQEANELE